MPCPAVDVRAADVPLDSRPAKGLFTARREGLTVQLRALHRMRLQVAELAMEDSALLEAANRRRQELERELSAVRSQEEVLAGRAHSSGGLLAAVDRQIERRQTGTATGSDASPDAAEETGHGGDPRARKTVPEAIRALLLEQEEATTKEITDNITKVCPDVKVKNVNTTLVRLKKRGLLVQPRLGVYRLDGKWAMAASP